ncbi:unnamed protein product [Ectocarpus sp. 12 AP-2014]
MTTRCSVSVGMIFLHGMLFATHLYPRQTDTATEHAPQEISSSFEVVGTLTCARSTSATAIARQAFPGTTSTSISFTSAVVERVGLRPLASKSEGQKERPLVFTKHKIDDCWRLVAEMLRLPSCATIYNTKREQHATTACSNHWRTTTQVCVPCNPRCPP